MPTQTNFSGGRGSLTLSGWLEGLQQGHISAYFILIALAVAATVALWAGTNMSKKEKRR